MDSESLKEEMNGSNWEDSDLIDINSFIDDVALENTPQPFACWDSQNVRIGAEVDVSFTGAAYQEKDCAELEHSRKRGRAASCSRTGTKACREKLRREKLNDRFSELSAILEPERPVKTDKLAILGDAIRVLNQLKSEVTEYNEAIAKLSEEIQTLKAEKNELREEKLKLKEDKERLEKEVQATTVSPPGFMTAHPAAYPTMMNKMAIFPGYGYMPMWPYLPPSTRDTSKDHELRPPVA